MTAFRQYRKAPYFEVDVYGARGDDSTDDHAAIAAAIADADASGGGVVMFGPKTYKNASKLTLPAAVHLVGQGAGTSILHHTGNTVCVEHIDDAAYTSRTSIQSMSITGNSGASAVGARICDSYGFTLRDVIISGFTGGVGLLNDDHSNWCEGMRLEDVGIRNCGTGIKFDSNGGSGSKAYTKFISFSINVPASSIGIDIAGTANVYSSMLAGNIWLEGNNAIAIQQSGSVGVPNSTLVNIVGEASGTGTIAIKRTAGTFQPSGRVAISSAATAVSGTNVQSSYFLATTAADTTLKPAVSPGISNHGGLGFVSQSNEEYPVLFGYNSTGKSLLRVAAKSFEQTGAAWDATASTRLLVTTDGNLGLGQALTSAATSVFGTGKGAIYVANASVVPSTNPSGGGVLYVEGGALKYRGSSGSTTTIAPA